MPPVVFGALEQPATPSAPSEPIAQAPARLRKTSRRAHRDRATASRALSLCRIRHTEVKKLWFVAKRGVTRVPLPSHARRRSPANDILGQRRRHADASGFGMYRYDSFDRDFVHARARQFRDQLERHLAGELSADD
nr:hypothetical protein [Caldimonas sp.]